MAKLFCINSILIITIEYLMLLNNCVTFQIKAEAIKLEMLKIKEEQKEHQEAEQEKQILEAKKREKEELKDKAPILNLDGLSDMVDPAPLVIIESAKSKSEEGLSGKDIEVIEDALEKLGKFI